MMMMTPSRRTSKALNLQIGHQIVPVAILNFLMMWSFHQRRCMRMGVMSVPWMRKTQSHVSGLFILDFVIIIIVFVKALFSICFFYSMLSSSYPCFICYFQSLVCDYILYINHFCGIVLGGFSIIRIFITNCKQFITFYYETISWYDNVSHKCRTWFIMHISDMGSHHHPNHILHRVEGELQPSIYQSTHMHLHLRTLRISLNTTAKLVPEVIM